MRTGASRPHERRAAYIIRRARLTRVIAHTIHPHILGCGCVVEDKHDLDLDDIRSYVKEVY